jgi:hypothetical protein
MQIQPENSLTRTLTKDLLDAAQNVCFTSTKNL